MDPEWLAGWWGVERNFIDPQVGGMYSLAWGISAEGFKYLSTGIIERYDPTSFLHVGKFMYFNPERAFLGPFDLIVEVKSAADGAMMQLSQGPYPIDGGPDWDWYYDAVKNAWPVVAETLKKYLEGKNH